MEASFSPDFYRSSNKQGFTLIELLVVIAIIAILAVVVVLTLNPAQMLAQSRDANRLSDIATLNSALNLYVTDQTGASSFSLGTTSDTYPSTADPQASSTLGDQCQNLGMASFNASSGQAWQCAGPSYTRFVNGTGWIPVNFSKTSAGSPIGSLPVDPTNQTSSGLFYSYNTNGSQFEVTADLESSKYKAQYGNAPQTSLFPEVISGGVPTVSALYNPTGLVGYWPLNEGSESSTIDQSGNGNNGVWSGTASGTSGFYSPGKVGNWAGYFNGTNDYISLTSGNIMTSFSVLAWINPPSNPFRIDFFDYKDIYATIQSGKICMYVYSVNTSYLCGGTTVPTNNWTLAAITWDGSTENVFYDGALDASLSISGTPTGPNSPSIGYCPSCGSDYFFGALGQVRLYNRALSPAEVMALYNSEK